MKERATAVIEALKNIKRSQRMENIFISHVSSMEFLYGYVKNYYNSVMKRHRERKERVG